MTAATSTADAAGRALVVEDDAGVGKLLDHVLQRMGYQVRVAQNGMDALSALSGSPFDLVLTDKNLPGASGVEVARRARDLLPDACVVLVSGYATSESADQLDGVVDAYIQKPFNITVLREQLALLRERRSGRAAPRPLSAPVREVGLLLSPGTERDELLRAFEAHGAHVHALSSAQAVEQLKDDAVLVVQDESCTHELYRAIWKRQARSPAFKVALWCSRDALRSSLNAVSLGAVERLYRGSAPEELARAVARLLKGARA